MSIPNLGKIIEERFKQHGDFLQSNLEESKFSKQMADLFEALFKYLEAVRKEQEEQAQKVLKKLGDIEDKIDSKSSGE
jgi:uncharacterized protein Yka (UPF0111/DUF47 family)